VEVDTAQRLCGRIESEEDHTLKIMRWMLLGGESLPASISQQLLLAVYGQHVQIDTNYMARNRGF
jgi:hypothetical protein